MRTCTRLLSVLSLLFVLAQTVQSKGDTTERTLRGVQFIDPLEGWAVGDGGTILHSIDGGITWESQYSGTEASLHSLQFVSPMVGWAVGTVETPSQSNGVLLHTVDAGQTWKSLATGALPGLNFIRFSDDSTGIVAGETTPWCPTGMHITLDGGKTWSAIGGAMSAPVVAAEFVDAKNGVMARADGKLDVLRDGSVLPAEYDSLNGRRVKAIRLVNQQAFGVGEGNLILTSFNSQGLRWGFAQTPWPKEVDSDLTWNSLTRSGSHLWAVGRPGSVVLHSADLGKTWELQPTNASTPLPLHSVQFIDEQFGWAVGEMGCVLKTIDGGKTWKAMTPKKRPGVLLHTDKRSNAPFEVVASLAKVEGWRTMGLRDGDNDVPSKKLAAWNLMGGNSWEQQTKALSLREAVLTLRTCQPEVTVGLGQYVWAEALQKALDPESFREQIELLHLKPWSPSKHYQSDPIGSIANGWRFLGTDYEEALRGSACEFAASSYLLLNETCPSASGFSVVLKATRLPYPSGNQLMDGISDTTEIRMVLPKLEKSKQSQSELRALMRDRQVIQALATNPNSFANSDSLIAQVKPLVSKMPSDIAARTSYALGLQMANAGHIQQAREIFLGLLADYPHDPLAFESLRWLVQYHSSSECRRRSEIRNHAIEEAIQTTTQLATKEEGEFNLNGYHDPGFKKNTSPTQDPNKKPVDHFKMNTTVASKEGGSFNVKRDLSLMDSEAEMRRWLAGAIEQEARLNNFGGAARRDLGVQLGFFQARRQAGDIEGAGKFLQKLVAELPKEAGETKPRIGRNPWQDVLLSERCLMNRADGISNPKPIVFCRRTTERPNLDGKFDDVCWSDAPIAKLKSVQQTTASDVGSQVRIRFDREYLYFAIECPHSEGKPIPKLPRRVRDMPMEGKDRISLFLDLDRDYQTFFRFEVAADGATREDCWGDLSWNPRWFVATESDAAAWRVELAIPLVELTSDSSLSGKIWAFNAIRTRPDGRQEAWSLREGIAPELVDMGLLQFMEPVKK